MGPLPIPTGSKLASAIPMGPLPIPTGSKALAS
jgi:hypothetical protein